MYTLFKSHCLNMYDSALWYHYTSKTLNRLYRLAIISAYRYYLAIASGLVLHRCHLSCVCRRLLLCCWMVRLCFTACGGRVLIVLYSFYSVYHCSFYVSVDLYMSVCRFSLSTLLCVCVSYGPCAWNKLRLIDCVIWRQQQNGQSRLWFLVNYR